MYLTSLKHDFTKVNDFTIDINNLAVFVFISVSWLVTLMNANRKSIQFYSRFLALILINNPHRKPNAPGGDCYFITRHHITKK